MLLTRSLAPTWDLLRGTDDGRLVFYQMLKSIKFEDVLDGGGIKFALIAPSKDLILKFDADPIISKRFDREHTWYEFLIWKQHPEYHKYYARIIWAYHGLIAQEYLPNVCSSGLACSSGKKIATKIFDSHYWHHVHLSAGQMKFFDYDVDGVSTD